MNDITYHMQSLSFDDLYEKIDVLTDRRGFVYLPDVEGIITMTPLAVFLRFVEFDDTWIPLSNLRVDVESKLHVAEWFYEKEF